MYQTLIFISHSNLLYKKRQSRQKKNYNDFSKQHLTILKQLCVCNSLYRYNGEVRFQNVFKIKFHYLLLISRKICSCLDTRLNENSLNSTCTIGFQDWGGFIFLLRTHDYYFFTYK